MTFAKMRDNIVNANEVRKSKRKRGEIMDSALFKYYAAKNGDNMRSVATFLNRAPSTITTYLHGGKTDFSRSDIAKLKQRWQLTPEQVDKIFFND